MKRLLLLLSPLAFCLQTAHAQLSFAPLDSLEFTGAGRYGTHMFASSFKVDINNDGFDDVVSLNGNTIMLALNTGTYFFEEPTAIYSDDEHIYNISNFVDLNNDTYPDAAISTAHGLKILYASGNAYDMAHEVKHTHYNYYGKLVLADTNEDGKFDLAASLQNSIERFNDVSTGLNDKSTFFTDEGQVTDFAIEDINTDDELDLIVSLHSKELKIYHGNPDNTLTLVFSTPVSSLIFFEVADLNLDGFRDLAYIEWGSNLFTLIYDNASKTFVRQAVFPDNAVPNNFHLVDLKNNGTPDLVYNQFFTLVVKENNGLGQFLAQKDLVENFVNPLTFTSFNLNDDGVADVLLSDYNKFQVVSFKADGTVEAKLTKGYLEDFWDVIYHDVDSDGFNDIISVSKTGSFTIRWGNEHYDYTNYSKYDIPFDAHYGAVMDFNGDGHNDILITQESNNNGVNNMLLVKGKGNRAFEEASDWKFFPDPGKPIIDDIDKDGVPDVLSYARYSKEIVWLDIEDPSYDEFYFTSRKFTVGGEGLRSVVSADINGDGYPDLLTANASSKNISILINNTSGNFDETLLTPEGAVSSVTGVQAFDYNMDEHLDLLVIVENTDYMYSLQVFLNDQLGNFTYEATHSLLDTFAPDVIHVTDIEGDGDLDLIVSAWDHASTNVFIRENGTISNIGSQVIESCGQGARIYEDLNNDGKPDIFTANFTHGGTFMQLNNSVQPPALVETEIVIDEINANSISITLGATSADGRLVVVTRGDNLAVTPADNFFYTHNSVFGVGGKLDANTHVVERGNKGTLEITGLSSSTYYLISVFEYNTNEPQVTIINYSGDKAEKGFITLNMPPAVAAIPDQNGSNLKTISLTLDITDGDNLLSEFEYQFASSNPEVVPVSNIVVNTTDEQAVLEITPIDYGESLIELTVIDTANNTAVVNFKYTSLIVGVEEGVNSGFAVYPNPFKTEVKIVPPDNPARVPAGSSVLIIYNAKGEVIKQFENIPKEVDLSPSPAGIYLFRTSGGDQYKAVKH